MLVADLVTGCGEVIDRCCGVDGVPTDDGVGEQGEAFALEILVTGVSPSDLTEVLRTVGLVGGRGAIRPC